MAALSLEEALDYLWSHLQDILGSVASTRHLDSSEG